MMQGSPARLFGAGRAALTALSLVMLALAVVPESARERALAAVAGHHPLDFTLRSAAGPLDTRSLRGSLVLVYFGYTSCPDVCPTTLADVASALRSLDARAAAVRVLFVSVDPARDTPARLAEYTAYFDRRIVGLTGSDDELAAVAARYGASFSRSQPDAYGDYAVSHSGSIYVRDQRGTRVATLAHGSSPARIAATLDALLAPAHHREEPPHAPSS